MRSDHVYLYVLCLCSSLATASPIQASERENALVERERRLAARQLPRIPERRAVSTVTVDPKTISVTSTSIIRATATRTQTTFVTVAKGASTSSGAKTPSFGASSTPTNSPVTVTTVVTTTTVKTSTTSTQSKTSSSPTSAALTTYTASVSPVPTSTNSVFVSNKWLTWYWPGLGACGVTNSNDDYIVAVASDLFNSYPGATWDNPNNNPICGKKLKITQGGKTVLATVQDACDGCNFFDLDLTPGLFSQFASLDDGVLYGATWQWA